MISGSILTDAFLAKKEIIFYMGPTYRKLATNTLKNTDKVYLGTGASLSTIREVCKDLKVSCSVHNKVNKMTLELLVANKYIVCPFIKTVVKNNYASRKYSKKLQDHIDSQGFTTDAGFTMNSGSALMPHQRTTNHSLVDLDNKLIRLNGDPHTKITENRMFMFEAGRLLAELGSEWSVEYETFEAITQRSLEIAVVSSESLRDSFIDLIKNTDKPSLAFRFFKNTGMLKVMLPELNMGVGLAQSNKSNNLDLFNHIMFALDSVSRSQANYEELRWTCLFHDIAKPYTKSYDKRGNIHFYGHDKIGAIFATRWLESHKFDKKLISKVATLCRHHLFDASPKLDLAAVTRLVERVGKAHVYDLIDMRRADRYGTGRKDISMKNLEILKGKVDKVLLSVKK